MINVFTQMKVVILHLVLLLTFTGCTLFNPYVEPKHHRPGLMRDNEGNILPNSENRLQAMHVTVGEAREYARLLQEAYRSAASDQSKTRNVIDLTSVAAAATAIGIAATGGSAETAGIIGLSTAGLAFAGSRLLVANRKTIWFRGALAMECVINASSTHAFPNLTVPFLGADLTTQSAAIETLRKAIKDFEGHINRVRNIPPKPNLSAADNVIREAENLAKRSDFINIEVVQLMDALDPLGQVLLSKIEEIRFRVDFEISKTEPDLLNYDAALRGLVASSPGGFISPESKRALIGEEDPSVQKKEFSEAIEPKKDTTFQTSFNNLNKAFDELVRANQQLITTLKEIEQKPVAFPPDIFNNCELGHRIGEGSLRLSRMNSTVTRGVETQFEVRISGGRPPYQRIEDTIPPGIDVQVTADVQSGGIMKITIPADIANESTSPVTIAVADADGDQRIFMIEFVEKKAIGTREGPPSSEPINRARGKVDEAESIGKIQKFLVDEGFDVGPSGIDKKWGPDTANAICLFLTQNFEDLKAMEEFKPDFEDKTAMPKCDEISKEDLIRYITKLF